MNPVVAAALAWHLVAAILGDYGRPIAVDTGETFKTQAECQLAEASLQASLIATGGLLPTGEEVVSTRCVIPGVNIT